MDVDYCIGIFLRDPVNPESCPLSLLRDPTDLDLTNCFVVITFGSWILNPGNVMGS